MSTANIIVLQKYKGLDEVILAMQEGTEDL